MINIVMKRAEETAVIPPPSAYNAEIVIKENGKILYIHVSCHIETVYTVATKSIYDYMTQKTDEIEDIDFIEEYIVSEEAMKSNYAKYFKIAEEMIEKL